MSFGSGCAPHSLLGVNGRGSGPVSWRFVPRPGRVFDRDYVPWGQGPYRQGRPCVTTLTSTRAVRVSLEPVPLSD